MADYFVIDADSHVEEPIEAWEHLDARYRERRPFPIAVPNRPDLAVLNATIKPRRRRGERDLKPEVV
jgi:hypothetical protein